MKIKSKKKSKRDWIVKLQRLQRPQLKGRDKRPRKPSDWPKKLLIRQSKIGLLLRKLKELEKKQKKRLNKNALRLRKLSAWQRRLLIRQSEKGLRLRKLQRLQRMQRMQLKLKGRD